MTDNEIIKALECDKNSEFEQEVLDFINRQKAEIERLEKELETEKNQVIRLESQIERLLSMNQAKLDVIHDLQTDIEAIKAEAYKECIEKVKENSNKMELVCSGALVRIDYTITEDDLDNLLKELEGEIDE